MKADLHIHTSVSDGRLSPGEVVRKGVKAGLNVIAITDHDSIEGISPALAEGKNYPQLQIVPGVEIDTDVPEGEVHILGYSMNYRDVEFNRILDRLRNSRLTRGEKMVARLVEIGINIEWGRVLQLAGGGVVGRPHIALAMLEKGYISSLGEAFGKYIGRNGSAYVEREKPTPYDAIKFVIKAGGLPVLAHPANIENLELLIPQLKQAGLAGMEIFYANYAAGTVAHLRELARKHKFIMTGGSDFHGLDSSIGADIGSIEIPQEFILQFISMTERKGW